jgi:hypothetical protein
MVRGCEKALATVSVMLGKHPIEVTLTIDDGEVAFLHVRRCRSCRASMTAEEHRTFVSRALLEIE